MTSPRRAIQPESPPPGWPGVCQRVRQFISTSWVPAAFLSGACLVAAGVWPVFSPAPAPLPDTASPPALATEPFAPEADWQDAATTAGHDLPGLVHEDPRPVPGMGSPTAAQVAGPRLVIDSIGISAPLSAVRVADGELMIPDDPARVGFWEDGARPGDDSGTVLVTGHVAWRQERGALWPLAGAGAGDVIEVVLDGRTTRWSVASVYALPRDADHPDLFTTLGPARLVVVTCGGPVLDGHYRDLVVVEAAPL